MKNFSFKVCRLSLSFLLIFLFFYLIAIPASLSGPDNFQGAVLQYYQKGFIPSLKAFREIAGHTPDNTGARLNLIELLQESGGYDEAINQIRELAGEDPSGTKWRTELIRTAYLAGRWTETVRWSEVDGLSAEELYWRGLALGELGKETEAIQSLTDSLAQESFNPMAYFQLGRFYQKAAAYEKAVTFYRKAAAQEPNLTTIYLPLAQTYLALKKYQPAYSLLLNAKTFFPWDQTIITTIQKLLAGHPELLQQQQAEAQKRRQTLVPPQVLPVTGDREKIPEIRIGLAEKVEKFYLKTGDRFRLSDQAGTVSYQADYPAVLMIKQNRSRIEIRDEPGDLLFTVEGSVSLSYDNPAATTVLFDVEYGRGTFWEGREDRIYRGFFQFLPQKNGVTIINLLNVEEYLYGVVPAEMEAGWPAGALEAQAVAARTYAFANLKSFESRGFDLLATVTSQVYKGVRAEKPATTAAVDTTRGRILRYQGKPIAAFYTANNGGYSSNIQDVWGISLPYLQAVPDQALSIRTGPLTPAELTEWLTTRPATYSSNPQYSGRSPYRWVLWVSRTDLENRLNLGEKLGSIVNVMVTERSLNGVVTKVLIKGRNGEYGIARDAIRAKLGGLRSNMFIVRPKMGGNGQPDYFIFYGGGWGHGVGMCQSGAAGMAADGYQCSEILSHYYPGTELASLY